MSPELFTLSESAARCGTTIERVRYAIHRGYFRPSFKAGKSWLLSPAEVRSLGKALRDMAERGPGRPKLVASR